MLADRDVPKGHDRDLKAVSLKCGSMFCALVVAAALECCGLAPWLSLAREATAAELLPPQKSPETKAAPVDGLNAPASPRAILREYDDVHPNGEYPGKVTWRVEPAGAHGAQIADIRADVEIPDRKFKMTMVFHRNTDASLPAEYVFELRFPPDVGDVQNIPGVLVKSGEQTGPLPMSGIAAKVGSNEFLFGLFRERAVGRTERNIQVVKDHPWFAVPIVYTNHRRDIIMIEKGSPGERAFHDALAAWGE